MSYRVLIVDDEPEIRQGLRLKADWEALGLTVAGEAADGREALERLAGEAIDIVIMDMNMPLMDGVSLLEACGERHPSLRCIVVTGYEDFQYARAAIRHHARDYLLKPVSQEELAAALRKVTRELDEERALKAERETVQWRLSQYYKQMKEHFIVHLVTEELEKEGAVRDKARLFQLDGWDGSAVRFVTAGLSERKRAADQGPGGRTPDKLRLPFELICREFAETYPFETPVFRDARYPGLIHFVLLDEQADAFAQALRQCVHGHLAFEPAVGAGRPVAGFTAWKEGYLSSLVAWNLAESDIKAAPDRQTESMHALTGEHAKLLQRYLSQGDLASFERAVGKELTDAFRESRARFVKTIFQLYLLLDSLAYEAGAPLDSGDQLWVRPEMALDLDSVEKARTFLYRLGSKIYRTYQAGSSDSDDSAMLAAKQFIDGNYMYDLHLTMLAERFNYHPSYFSELFKAKIGKTFIQYLTEVRMAEAVRLLQEAPLSLWDIAELTGFASASYFSSRFKRMYGMTPSEFRQQRSGSPHSEKMQFRKN